MSPDEHSVTLTIYSASLSSTELADQIGIPPDQRWDRGDRTNRGYERTRTAARYDSGLPPNVPANEQISALLARVAPATTQLADLARAPDGEITLSVGYFINEDQWQDHDDHVVVRGLGVSLHTAEIELLHAIGAHFDVDIYVNDDQDR